MKLFGFFAFFGFSFVPHISEQDLKARD